MVRSQVADGGNSLLLWTVAVNTWNNLPHTTEKGCPSSLGVGFGANGPLTVKLSMLGNFETASDLNGFFR
jgi:hypothetical protein